MGNERYDVAIVGAGPAGAAAANLLAKKELKVVVVDSGKFPRTGASSTWFSGGGMSLMKELGAAIDKLPVLAFKDVTFFSADFSKTAKPTFDEPAGYLMSQDDLASAMVAAASDAGATVLQGKTVADIRLGESTATLELADGGGLESRLLLLAAGRQTPLLTRCGFSPESGEPPLWSAQLDVEHKSKGSAEPRVSIVLGLDRGAGFGVFCVTEDHVAVSVHWAGDRTETITTLINLCKMGLDHEILPVDIAKRAAAAKVVASPAAAALGMDTHVGKHTLLIGDAGGFIAAASNEGVYPAMWSAKIAARVAEAALSHRYSQDELMSFNSQWRMEMADYLRSPNTDTQFLLPLIFSNQAMTDRMGAAFFNGENI